MPSKKLTSYPLAVSKCTCHDCEGKKRYQIPVAAAKKYDRESAAKDAVVSAAHKATCAWPGSGALTMPALNKALDKLEQVRDES